MSSFVGNFWLLDHELETNHTRSVKTWTAVPTSLSLISRTKATTQWMNTSGVWTQNLSWVKPTTNHLNYGLTVSCMYHRYINVRWGGSRWRVGLCPTSNSAEGDFLYLPPPDVMINRYNEEWTSGLKQWHVFVRIEDASNRQKTNSWMLNRMVINFY